MLLQMESKLTGIIVTANTDKYVSCNVTFHLEVTIPEQNKYRNPHLAWIRRVSNAIVRTICC